MKYLTHIQIQRYGVGILAVILAAMLMLVLDPWVSMSQTPFLLFFGAVMISAWYGGIASGMLATGLSAVVSEYFFLFPAYSLALEGENMIRLSLFSLQGIFVSGLCQALHAAKTKSAVSLRSLSVSEERYRQILDTASEGIWIIDAEARTEYINQRLAQMFGYSRDEMLNRPIFEFMDESVRAEALQHLKRQPGIQAQFDFCYRRKDGSDLWAIVCINSIFDQQGEFVGSLAMLTDISDRKSSEQALEAANQQIANILESITDAFLTLDSEWRFTYVNHQCEKLIRRSREQLLGQNIWEMFPQAVGSVFYEQYHKAVNEQIAVTVEAVLPVGSGRWFEARAYPKSNGLAIFFQDITNRKQAELALRASETRFANLATNLPGVIYQYRLLPDGRDEFPYISSGCLDFYEIDSQNIQQHPHLFWQAIHPDDVEGLRRSLSLDVKDGQWRYEWRIVTPSGRIKWLQATARAEFLPDGGVMWDGVMLDISDRKQLENQLRQQAGELERANLAKDEFLAILSHELRTPLNAILNWSQLLRRRQLNQQTTARALETIERNAARQTQLVEDLLDVSQILQGKLRLKAYPIDLVSLITAAIERVRSSAEEKSIDLRLTILDFGLYFNSHKPSQNSEYSATNGQTNNLKSKTQSPQFLVSGDSHRLQQVVWNLLSNAIKFTPQGGQVEVRLSAVSTQKQLTTNQYAQIQVIDSGIGFNPEFVPHMFDYFRQADSSITRSFGGLGLGLAIARQIVEMHGGTVQAHSSGEGQGATFTLVLPLVNNLASNPSGVASPNRRRMGRAKNEKNDRSLLIDSSGDRQGQQMRR